MNILPFCSMSPSLWLLDMMIPWLSHLGKYLLTSKIWLNPHSLSFPKQCILQGMHSPFSKEACTVLLPDIADLSWLQVDKFLHFQKNLGIRNGINLDQIRFEGWWLGSFAIPCSVLRSNPGSTWETVQGIKPVLAGCKVSGLSSILTLSGPYIRLLNK